MSEGGFDSLDIELTKEQNFYPDVTFRDRTGNLFAVDLKSSYRKTEKKINGMTLGTFTGYFRNRRSTKNITYPYSLYKAHIVLGVIYSEESSLVDEFKLYSIADLEK